MSASENSVTVSFYSKSEPVSVKRRHVDVPSNLHVRFLSRESCHYTPDYGIKNIFAFLLILLIPNLVMIQTFIVLHCKSSFLTFLNFISKHSLYDSLSAVWFHGNIDFLFGFSVVLGYMLFALTLMVFVPGKVVLGPTTPNGNVPEYKDNGFYCYLLSIASFLIIACFLSYFTEHSVSIVYTKLPSLFYCLNIFSLVFCLFLYLKGLYFPSCSDNGSSGYFFFDYYWGTELHPRVFGVDLKIFTNCRCGMTFWALLILCYVWHSVESQQLHGGQVVNAVLQLLYITKFFWWEAGYYSTLDIMLDRAGFYICWGCLCFVPSMYTLSSFYMASQFVSMHQFYYITIFIIGIFSLIINYWADYQKQVFRSTKGNCLIWGKPPEIIEAFYTGQDGSLQKNLLLASGFWGLARHFHYLPELILAFSWCSSAGFHHLMPFCYFIFLVILLIHRVKRDNDKCVTKYGDFFLQYKKKVPWKIIPYIY